MPHRNGHQRKIPDLNAFKIFKGSAVGHPENLYIYHLRYLSTYPTLKPNMSLDTPPLSKNSLQKKGVAYLGNNMNLALYQNLVW